MIWDLGRPHRGVGRAERTWVCAGVLTGLLGLSESAWPCSEPYEPSYPLLGEYTDVVPADGVFVARFYECSSCESSAVELTVTDASGQLVPGTVIDIGYHEHPGFAWKPDAPLQESEVYTAHPGAPFMGDDVEAVAFTASAAQPELTPGMTPVISFAPVRGLTGEKVCCTTYMDSCGNDTMCLSKGDGLETKVNVSVGATMEDLNRSLQFVYFVRIAVGDREVVSDWSTAYYAFLQVPESESYCYELRARHISTGREIVLGNECTADDVEPVDEEALRNALLDSALKSCFDPPPGLEQRWCEVNAEAIALGGCEDWGEGACDEARAVCTGSFAPGVDAGAGASELAPDGTDVTSNDGAVVDDVTPGESAASSGVSPDGGSTADDSTVEGTLPSEGAANDGATPGGAEPVPRGDGSGVGPSEGEPGSGGAPDAGSVEGEPVDRDKDEAETEFDSQVDGEPRIVGLEDEAPDGGCSVAGERAPAPTHVAWLALGLSALYLKRRRARNEQRSVVSSAV